MSTAHLSFLLPLIWLGGGKQGRSRSVRGVVMGCCLLFSTASCCYGQSFSLCAGATGLYLPSSPWQNGAAAGLLWADTAGHWLIQAEYEKLGGSSLYAKEAYRLHDRTQAISMRIAHGVAHQGPHTLYLGTRLSLFKADRAIRGQELSWRGSSEASGSIIALTALWRWRFSKLGALHASVEAGHLHVHSSGVVVNGLRDRPLEHSFILAFGLGASIAFL